SRAEGRVDRDRLAGGGEGSAGRGQQEPDPTPHLVDSGAPIAARGSSPWTARFTVAPRGEGSRRKRSGSDAVLVAKEVGSTGGALPVQPERRVAPRSRRGRLPSFRHAWTDVVALA